MGNERRVETSHFHGKGLPCILTSAATRYREVSGGLEGQKGQEGRRGCFRFWTSSWKLSELAEPHAYCCYSHLLEGCSGPCLHWTQCHLAASSNICSFHLKGGSPSVTSRHTGSASSLKHPPMTQCLVPGHSSLVWLLRTSPRRCHAPDLALSKAPQ